MTSRVKINLLLVFFLVAFSMLILRASYWQIIRSEQLAIAADQEHFQILEIPAVRGKIQSHDAITLVENKPSYILYANKHQISQDHTMVMDKIVPLLLEASPLLATNSGELADYQKKFKEKLDSPLGIWVRLAVHLTPTVKEKIESQKIAGLSFVQNFDRDYLEASMAAHLLGFVGENDKGLPQGYFGVEGFYDKELSGKPGKFLEEMDAFGNPIVIGEVKKEEPVNGSNLELSLDRSVQFFVEKYLAEGIGTWGAKGGTAIVLNPKDGELIASVSFPNYDPNTFAFGQTVNFKDPMLSDLYEPGSIMKPLIMAAAINEEKLTPASRCPVCTGPVPIGEYFVHTFNNQYHPNLTMTEVLVNSDNTGMVYVGRTLGFAKLYDYLLRYGFSEKTGVDLEGETFVPLRPSSQWYPIDQATVTFGQGIAITPLQMIRAFSLLANKGELVTPHAVQIIRTEKDTKLLTRPAGRRIISETTAKVLTEMLIHVANESPLHFPKERTPGLEKFRIAAKSGTAQVPIAGHYEQGRTIGSVIGFAPADDPKFLVMVKLDSPTVRPWGSDTAGPVFFKIVAELLNYYNITPTE